MVGSIIWEYLIPLVSNDQYLMEDQMVQFYSDLMDMNESEYIDLVLKTMELHFSVDQLIDWTCSLMQILCKRIS